MDRIIDYIFRALGLLDGSYVTSNSCDAGAGTDPDG